MREKMEKQNQVENKPNVVILYEELLNNKKNIYFDVDGWEEIIDYYISVNEFDNSLVVCSRAEKQHPYSSSLTIRKAQVLIESGNPEKGLEILEEIHSLEPNNAEIIMLKGIALVNTGDVNNAMKYFEIVLKEVENTEDEEYILHDIAITFMQLTQYSIALKYLNQAYDVNPDYISLSYDIGFCLERIDKDEESIDYFKKYLTEYPYSKIAWYNLGVVYKKLKFYDQAIEAYDFAYAIDDKFSSPLYNKAYILVKLQKYKEAIKIYNEFLTLEPENAAVYCFIGECYENLNEYKSAEKYYKHSLELDDKFADAWYGLGILKVYKDKFAESIEFLTNAAKFDRANPGYYFTLAKVYNNLEKTLEAEILFRQTLKIEPYNSDFWISYSELKYNQKDSISAIKILQKAKELLPDDAVIDYRLAAYLFSAGKNSVAYRHLKHALKQDYKSHKLFLEYYPQGKINEQIKKLIESYTSSKKR